MGCTELTKRNRGFSMGRYIDDILQPGEKVLYSTNAHWIFYFPAIVAWIVAVVLLILSRATTTEGIILLCPSASAVAAPAAPDCYFNDRFSRCAHHTHRTTTILV